MAVFDPRLRTQVVYDIAVRYSGPLWPLGATIRGVCVCGLWLLLIWFPDRALVVAPLFLVLVTAGVGAAWLHTRGRLLYRLAGSPAPALRQAARHLSSTQGRATADLSGVMESTGIVVALLLFTVVATSLPSWVYLTGLSLAAVHVWSAWSQVMTDASWYNPDSEPHPGLVWFRPLMPAAVALIAFALDGWREMAGDGSPPGGLAVALLLSGSVLLLVPYTLLFELVLRSASQACGVEVREARSDDSNLVHSLVKNVAHNLVIRARDASGLDAEIVSLINRVMAGTEEARRLMLGHDESGKDVVPHSVGLLWDSIRPIVPASLRAKVSIDPASREVLLVGDDYGLARLVMSDLVTNAWKAGSANVRVAVATEPGIGGWISVLVDDDGPGIPPGALSSPLSSIHILGNRLRKFGGTLTFSDRAGGGTLACARWRPLRG